MTYTLDLFSSNEAFCTTLGVLTVILIKMAVFRVVILCR